MRLESVSKIVSAEMRKVDNAKKENAPSKLGAYTRTPDKASLSSESQNINDIKASISVVAARIQAEPDVRADKVSDVRRKLDEGYYNSSSFADQLAERLTKELGL